jgi:hypothetical protein
MSEVDGWFGFGRASGGRVEPGRELSDAAPTTD